MPRSRRPPDLFGRVPSRFTDTLLRGDITFDQFAIGAFLAVKCNESRTRVAICHLDSLIRELRFAKKRDALRRDLAALRPAWIDYEVEERQRRPYEFRLTGLQIRDASAAEPEQDPLQSTSRSPQTELQSNTAANPATERHSSALTPESSRSDSSSGPFSSHLVSSLDDRREKQRDLGASVQQKEPELPPWQDPKKNPLYWLGEQDERDAEDRQ